MSRITDGATRVSHLTRTASSTKFVLATVLFAALGGGVGCKELDGRNSNRHGNRLFRDMQFIDAAGAYEKALKTVDDPIIHYNIGLAYSKVYRPGSDKPVLFGETDEEICKLIPGAKPVDARVCVKKPGMRTDEKENIRRYPECSDKKEEVCPSSFDCKQTKLCSLDSPTIANMAADHFQVWIKSQPPDEELAKSAKEVRDSLKVADEKGNKGMVSELEKKLDELTLKGDIRKLVTGVWIDTDQHAKAIAYWEAELAAKPKNTEILGILAGLHLKANNWRKSVDLYNEIAALSPDVESKVGQYVYIGNVAWSKLNSKTLGPEEAVELADKGIAATQKALELQPKLPKLWGLQASIFGFRALTHGAMFAAYIDRATVEDLKRHTRVLSEEAKKQQEGAAPASPSTPAPGTPSTPAPPASPSMSGGPAKTSGG